MNLETNYNSIKIRIIFFPLLLIALFRFFYLFNYKICICTVGKMENKYIKEFVEYYKHLGVDKIFLYDNNELNGEKFEDVIDI